MNENKCQNVILQISHYIKIKQYWDAAKLSNEHHIDILMFIDNNLTNSSMFLKEDLVNSSYRLRDVIVRLKKAYHLLKDIEIRDQILEIIF